MHALIAGDGTRLCRAGGRRRRTEVAVGVGMLARGLFTDPNVSCSHCSRCHDAKNLRHGYGPRSSSQPAAFLPLLSNTPHHTAHRTPPCPPAHAPGAFTPSRPCLSASSTSRIAQASSPPAEPDNAYNAIAAPTGLSTRRSYTNPSLSRPAPEACPLEE